MTLDVPDLGDRDYAAYLAEARRRIPTYAEEWTDHNAHDPGIAFLELFAWLAETYVYQLDRFGDRQIRKYLELLGDAPKAPLAASVALRLAPASGSTVDLTTGMVLAAGIDRRTAFFFETTALGPVDSVSVVDAAVDRVVVDHVGGRVDNSVVNDTEGMGFLAFGPDATAGSQLYLGFDDDPFPEVGAPGDPSPRVALGVAYDDRGLPTPATHGEEPSTFDPSVELAWEFCVDYDRWYANDGWDPLPVVFDGTNHLYESGSVVFERPAESDVGVPAPGAPDPTRSWPARPGVILDDDRARYWLRCVVEVGGYEIPPRLSAVALNVVPAVHRRTVHNETLTRADGRAETTAHPGQVFEFDDAPVLEADIAVVPGPADAAAVDPAELADPANVWHAVKSFDGQGPEARVFLLDTMDGRLTFGDEVAGAVPTAGSSVVATRTVYGGGSAGNVSPTVPWQFVDEELADVSVSPFSDATGGTDAETVKAALARVRRDLQLPYRAVTADDYRAVAKRTPGLRFGRAHATVVSAADDPDACTDRGEVRVVVVPYGTHPQPVPSAGFLDAVRCHLAKHALVTDRVTVHPPSYVGVGVSAVVSLAPTAAVAERTVAITEALEAFIHPLSGFDGDGWPFGRSVYRSELHEVIEAVEGVDCVVDLSVTARGAGRVGPDGDVALDETGLPYSLDHEVVVEVDTDTCGEEF
ncbi:putative baseplate assembly protein [Halogranum amylolyticum]|uniref:Putative baseplate assembly protein n=1 Tax=Halogranum amylolyticum TaxID=660520 RepID=A0A1H8WGS8_9EURY|nr:putative baseplate assembly protein [Halogranum amylolyticum]SEP26627.1 putative baseplate assembly protein [Halogranum amylolyticum]